MAHRQAKASAHKTPSLVHRHRLSRSPTEIHYGASPPRRGSHLPPYKVSAPLHTKSEGRRREYFACLGKTSLKLALSRTKPIQVHKALSQSFSQVRRRARGSRRRRRGAACPLGARGGGEWKEIRKEYD